ncbi:MAG: PAS domain-containing protein, partial [Geminicoccaceae bacterium]
AYERWFGHARDNVYGLHVREVLGAEAYGAVQGFIEHALRGETVSFESAVPYRDGGTRRVHATYVPDIGADGDIKGFFAVVTDITEP